MWIVLANKTDGLYTVFRLGHHVMPRLNQHCTQRQPNERMVIYHKNFVRHVANPCFL
ncbi:hypothetical protein D3C76_1544850 [compost metagenome]